MAQCSNCKTSLSCGCQQRTASDQRAVCTNCITTYENQLLAARNNAKLNSNK